MPAYVVASYTNMAHTVGTFDAWRHLGSAKKWLRIHNTQEWTDYYSAAQVEDLRRFFDHYTRGVDNGWPATPRVRMAVLDPGGTDIVNRAETAFPPTRAVRKKLFLHRDALSLQPLSSETSVAHKAEGGTTKFLFAFAEDTEISGYMTLRLWMQADGADDMDVTVSVRKRPGMTQRLREILPGGPDGNASSGMLRVSYRELDPLRSTEFNPVLAMRREQRLKPGEIVPVTFSLSPSALRFRAGEELELSVSGFRFPPFIPLSFGEAKVPFPVDGLTFPPERPGEVREFHGGKEASATRLAPPVPPSRNQGRHILRIGGKYDCHLSFSEVPPR